MKKYFLNLILIMYAVSFSSSFAIANDSVIKSRPLMEADRAEARQFIKKWSKSFLDGFNYEYVLNVQTPEQAYWYAQLYQNVECRKNCLSVLFEEDGISQDKIGKCALVISWDEWNVWDTVLNGPPVKVDQNTKLEPWYQRIMHRIGGWFDFRNLDLKLDVEEARDQAMKEYFHDQPCR